MTNQRPNIRLLEAAELRRSGPLLSLRKGLNELRLPRRGQAQPRLLPAPLRPPILSLIICTAGTCAGLERALRTALNQTAAKDTYEVLVVWNRPEPPPAGAIPEGIRWVREPVPGLARARNTGAAQAAGEFLLYMDDDAAAAPTLAGTMRQAFLLHRRAAVIGGQVFLALPDPPPEALLPGKEGLWSAYIVPFKRYRPVREQYAFPYGACFGVRWSALKALGGFPLNYGRVGAGYAGGEETALCFRAQAQGWEVGVEPAARVEHWVEPWRFTRRHIQETLRASILTTYRLCQEGYAPWRWDMRYIQERLRIADRELSRLAGTGTELECYYKKCERDAFAELFLTMRAQAAREASLC